MQAPVIVLNNNTKREQGRKAQISNIQAARNISDIVRTCLGPHAMLKMLLDPMGGIVLTNDGHCILREVEAAHPAAKSMLELSRSQDEEVGDGTTSVIVLAGEILGLSLPLLENVHPTVIISAFKKGLYEAIRVCESIGIPVDVENEQSLKEVISTCLATKFTNRWSDLLCDIAMKAVKTVKTTTSSFVGDCEQLNVEVDIKKYVRIEKIPGASIEESCVLDGIMINKDVLHASMKRKIENPRILLLDCGLEYKKGESQTNIEVTKEEHWNQLLKQEEEQVKNMCDLIIKANPNLVFVEKGVSDLAQHFLAKAGITVLRRVKKSDNNRIAKAVGATIVHRLEEIREEDLGLKCGLFEVRKLGDEYYSYIIDCKEPQSCTVVLRGPTKDVINEVERNLHDALSVARNVFLSPSLCPGGGATELAVSAALIKLSEVETNPLEQPALLALAEALEVIPATLAKNCGAKAIRVLSELKAKHMEGEFTFGVDGDTGKMANIKDLGIYEPSLVKIQTLKTAIEAACLLLRVDDIVSAISKKKQ